MQQAFSGTRKPVLSVVIINWNTGRLLQQAIQSLYDTTGSVELELFVVDNGSSDNSITMIQAQFPHVNVLLQTENLGFTRAVNLALAKGRGDFFLLAHPDLKFLPGAIQVMLSFLRTHPDVGIVGGNLMYPDGTSNECAIRRLSVGQSLIEFLYGFRSLIQFVPWGYTRLLNARKVFYWDHQTMRESEIIWNACMMFKKEVIETIGSFCEQFFVWYADVDWCHRATCVGWKAYYLANAQVIHYERQSREYLDNDQVRYKVDGFLVKHSMHTDKYTLLKRHYSPWFLWFEKCIDLLSTWRTFLKRTLLRVLRLFNNMRGVSTHEV